MGTSLVLVRLTTIIYNTSAGLSNAKIDKLRVFDTY